MDTEYRPTINFTVTLALERDMESSVPMVFANRIALGSNVNAQRSTAVTQIGGIVYEESLRQPIAGAEIIHLESMRVLTDEFGRYAIRGLREGEHRLKLTVNDVSSERRIRLGPLEDSAQYDLPCRL